MLGNIFRDSVLYLVKVPLLRRFLGNLAQRRYHVSIHPHADIARNVAIPRHISVGAGARILPTAILAPYITVEPNALVDGRIPTGAIVAGNPGRIVGFSPTGKRLGQSRPLAQEALYILVNQFKFNSVLDIGCGEGWHATRLQAEGRQVTCVDIGDSCYFQQRGDTPGIQLVIGNYLDMEFPAQFDCIWLSHVLEHQLDVQRFLEKVHRDLAEDGILAITVPPLKSAIVGGHINLFNMGLLLYRLVLAGFDCSQAHCKAYGYNLSVIVRKKSVTLPQIEYDSGDVEKLAAYFPFGAIEGFEGEIDSLNWPWPQHELFDEPASH